MNKSTKKQTSKRKSTSALEDTRSAKQPRLTIDSFFTPKVTVQVGSGLDGVAGGVEGKVLDVVLSDEQMRVMRMVVEEGKNIFFTGSAGTGKSLLLKAIVTALKKKYAKKPGAVSVTASTGMAASNIGGMTLHSWGAIAPTVDNIDRLIKSIRTARPALLRWKTTQILIIDEVSMVDGHLFEKIAAIATQLRKKTDRPFGGIQLVVTGDFFQLPPVTEGGKQPFFAFECDAWKACIEHTVSLTRVFRQKDNKFVQLLNELREGSITPLAIESFRALPAPSYPTTRSFRRQSSSPHATKLSANSTRLASLQSPPVAFDARDSGSAAPEKRKAVLANMRVPERLILKQGAQVMLVKNIDDRRGLVNGAVGRVLGFFAAPRGKSEGVISNVEISEDGKSVVFAGAGKENVKPGSTAPARVPKKEGAADAELFPLVEFPTPMGRETALVTRDEFRIEDNEGVVLARRVQVPLILAWAISIHKSQGQTIHRVKVDLGRVFEKGQSYVALSRAATMEGLQVLRFDPKKVSAHPRVIEWSKTLECLA